MNGAAEEGKRFLSPVNDVPGLNEEVDAARPTAFLVHYTRHLQHLLGVRHVPMKVTYSDDSPGKCTLDGFRDRRRRGRRMWRLRGLYWVMFDDAYGLKGLLGRGVFVGVLLGLLVWVDGEGPSEGEAEGGDD